MKRSDLIKWAIEDYECNHNALTVWELKHIEIIISMLKNDNLRRTEKVENYLYFLIDTNAYSE